MRTELKLRIWPDKILRTKCKAVTNPDANIRRILDQMYTIMKINRGIGLAATQVGLDICCIIVEAEDRVFRLLNPKIIKKEGTQIFEEGCLSFPGLSLRIKRARSVWVTAMDEWGDPLDIEAEGLLAVVFQHEIDHINGIVFIDRIPLWERMKILPVLRKMEREYGVC